MKFGTDSLRLTGRWARTPLASKSVNLGIGDSALFEVWWRSLFGTFGFTIDGFSLTR